MKLICSWLLMACIGVIATADPIHVEHIERSNPRQRLHIATIDLTDPRISLRVVRAGPPTTHPTTFPTSLRLPSVVADREGFRLAVNGDLFMAGPAVHLFGRQTPYFVGNGAAVCGWAVSDGQAWSGAGVPACLAVTGDRQVMISRFHQMPHNVRQLVSGSTLILTARQIVANGIGKEGQPYPRTAVGIDAKGTTLTIMVVDGHRPDYSVGMTLRQVAEELLLRGCSDALNLDGGGSSVMVEKTGDTPARVISRPSDGYDLPLAPSLQRPVASVLGVCCATQPTVP